MRIRFTKMQGAGNDFVVLDAVREPALARLTPEQLRRLGDRHFGIGADQILLVQPPTVDETEEGIDFRYRIYNGASGGEVEHCGNGARCFVRYVRDQGLARRPVVRVATVNNRLELREEADGRVTVDMNTPRLDPLSLPFDPAGLQARPVGGAMPGYGLWSLDGAARAGLEVALVSMGNPHAVLMPEAWHSTPGEGAADIDAAPVAELGPWVETHPRFPRRVNVGFVQPLARSAMRLRVFERDAGETLACGTGACAAVVAGIALGRFDERVDVHTRGGLLTISWAGRSQGASAPVLMTGPAETVFTGEITL